MLSTGRADAVSGAGACKPSNKKDALGYVTKYAVKGGDIDLGGPWFRDRPSGQLLPFDVERFGQVHHS